MKLRTIILFGLTTLLMACGGGGAFGGGEASASASNVDSTLTEDSLITVNRCSKIAGGLLFQYVVNTFSSNDKFITCSVSGGAFQVFNAVFYKPTFVGHVSESCLLVSDADSDPTSGYWIFSVNAGVRTAIYNDSSSAVNGYNVTFSNTTDCTTN